MRLWCVRAKAIPLGQDPERHGTLVAKASCSSKKNPEAGCRSGERSA
jgi:hypothetical protein